MASRRKFLTTLIASAVPLGTIAYALMAQVRPGQAPPKPGQKEDDPDAPKFDPKNALENNKKDIKKSIERLFQLASELKAEIEKTDSVQVLSVAMLKKTEEIEKLAKGIRSRAIG
jgi:peptidoglycan hydrolase CwlO-like protein